MVQPFFFANNLLPGLLYSYTKKLTIMKFVQSGIIAFALSMFIISCGDTETKSEKAAEKVEEMADDAGDAVEDATDEMGDKAEEAGDEIEDAIDG